MTTELEQALLAKVTHLTARLRTAFERIAELEEETHADLEEWTRLSDELDTAEQRSLAT